MKKKWTRERSKRASGIQKTLLIVKLAFCMLLLTVTVSAKTHSQVRLSISVENATLAEVFDEITRSTGYEFIYSNSELSGLNKVDIAFADTDLQVILSRCLEGTGLWYAIEDQLVIISPKIQAPRPQRTPVTGTVRDREGNAIAGVAVVLKGTSTGVATDANGRFRIEVATPASAILQFSFLGKNPLEITVGERRELEVVLEDSQQQIDQVVVTGIFQRNKEGFSGSVTEVSGEQIRQLSSGNILKALEIIDPGFKMNVSNISGSNPNAVPDFTMRGQASMGTYESEDVVVLRGDLNTRPNQPLFVLDGVIGVSATKIMDLDPDQIESITLLKDASATVIYGSNAANGVVVVETKPPVEGKLRFSYSGNYGLDIPDLSVYDLMNAREKLEAEEKAGYYSFLDEIGLQNYRNAIEQEVLRGVDTYWLKYPVQTAFTHRHGVTMEGGDSAIRYKIYLGASFAPGVMKKTNLDTKTGRVDLQYRSGKFMLSNQLSVNHSNGRRVSPYGSFQEYAKLNPYFRPTDENGQYRMVLSDFGYTDNDGYPSSAGWANAPVTNPLYNTMFNSLNDSRNLEIREALMVEYMPVDNLRLSLDFSIAADNGTVEVFKSAQHTDFYQPSMPLAPENKGRFDMTKSEGYNYRVSLSANYNKVFGGDHLLSAYLRYTVNERQTKYTNISQKGFPNDNLKEIYMGVTDACKSGSESTARSLGIISTVNYIYKQRYAVDFSMSIDASSEFGRNNRFAPFWSAGVRWNADKEEFIKRLGVFDELILRATYGVTGSQGFSPYQTLQMYTYTNLMKTYLSFPVVGTGDLQHRQPRSEMAADRQLQPRARLHHSPQSGERARGVL